MTNLPALFKLVDDELAGAVELASEGFVVDEDGGFSKARTALREILGEFYLRSDMKGAERRAILAALEEK